MLKLAPGTYDIEPLNVIEVKPNGNIVLTNPSIPQIRLQISTRHSDLEAMGTGITFSPVADEEVTEIA